MDPTQEHFYVRQILKNIKEEIDTTITTVGYFNTPLLSMDRSSRQKISKETQALNDTIDKLDLIDIYRIFHPKAADYAFFSSAHRTFSRTDHMRGHKASFSKFKKIKTVSSIFSDHNAVRLEINYNEKTLINTNMCV